MNIQDSVVFITGANRGIGKAYVEAFLRAGVKKIYLGVRNPDSVKEIVENHPERCEALKLDVTCADDIKSAALQAQDVNILINNAGILFFDNFTSPELVDNARQQFEVNYVGPLLLTQEFAPILKNNGGGIVVTVSSIVGHVAMPGIVTYCASKFAAQALILNMRAELTGQGTHVIGVYPGPIATDMAADLEMDKFPPEQVAQATLKAIENREEDVFPDAFSQGLYETLRKDPKDVEAQMLAMAQQDEEAA